MNTNKRKKKTLVKIAMLLAPVIALVVATVFGLEETAQAEINEILISIIAVVAGALGVTGVVMVDKDDKKNDNIDK